MPKKAKILFVCSHNSARSQMAEAYFNFFYRGEMEAESAGLEPGTLNPRVVRAMAEEGIDIAGNSTKSVFSFYKEGRIYRYVVTVCDEKAAEGCPIFPGITTRLHWSFDDPSAFTGSDDEIMEQVRTVRNLIKEKILEFIATIKE